MADAGGPAWDADGLRRAARPGPRRPGRHRRSRRWPGSRQVLAAAYAVEQRLGATRNLAVVAALGRHPRPARRAGPRRASSPRPATTACPTCCAISRRSSGGWTGCPATRSGTRQQQDRIARRRRRSTRTCWPALPPARRADDGGPADPLDDRGAAGERLRPGARHPVPGLRAADLPRHGRGRGPLIRRRRPAAATGSARAASGAGRRRRVAAAGVRGRRREAGCRRRALRRRRRASGAWRSGRHRPARASAIGPAASPGRRERGDPDAGAAGDQCRAPGRRPARPRRSPARRPSRRPRPRSGSKPAARHAAAWVPQVVAAAGTSPAAGPQVGDAQRRRRPGGSAAGQRGDHQVSRRTLPVVSAGVGAGNGMMTSARSSVAARQVPDQVVRAALLDQQLDAGVRVVEAGAARRAAARWHRLGVAPSRTRPRRSPTSSCTSCRAVSASARIRRASGSSASPASVSVMLPRAR